MDLLLTFENAAGAVEVANRPWLGYQLLDGFYGLDDGPVGVLERSAGSVAGSTIAGLERGSREVFVPVRVQGRDEEHWHELASRLRRVLSPHAGPVTLAVTTRWGTRRITGTRTTSGTDPWARGTRLVAAGRSNTGITLVCPDPFWRGDPVELAWSPPADPPPFLESLLPVALASSQVFGSTQLAAHGGDVPGVGVWSLAGPWTRARLSDETSGRAMVLEPPEPVALGEVVTVHTDVRSGVRVVAPDGSSAWPWLRPPFDVWSPQPDARVRVQMEGTGEGSSARLVVTPRFESAL